MTTRKYNESSMHCILVRPRQCSIRLTATIGKLSSVHGECDVDAEIGRSRLHHSMLVADLSNDVLLGLQFLHRHNISWICGPRSEDKQRRNCNVYKLIPFARSSPPKMCSSLGVQKT